MPASPGAVAVEGWYDALNRLSGELTSEHPDWAWVNITLRPWYAEGAKTIAYEVAEDLDWAAPDHVVVPMASGALAVKTDQGFTELVRAGLLDRVPALTVAQPGGCAPVAEAFAAGRDDVDPVRPATVAGSLAMGDPPDGAFVLAAVRRTGGRVIAAPEEGIPDGAALLHRTEGIATEPAGGVVVGALRSLAGSGLVRPGQRIVAILTAGARPVSRAFAPAVTIRPTVADFESWYSTTRLRAPMD